MGAYVDYRSNRDATLHDQVERMLKHPKATAFTENFAGQWLGLREIDATEPSHLLYSEFDHMLKVSMIRETELFFAEVLKNDLSLTNFVASCATGSASTRAEAESRLFRGDFVLILLGHMRDGVVL